MRVLVTGVAGQLGHDIAEKLAALKIENKGVDIEDFDLTDEQAVLAAIRAYAPTHVIHCAAYTAVDKAEQEPGLCAAVNVDGTRHIARACREVSAEMLYFSTDYVFDGFSKEEPWETGDKKDPQNQYGKTKLRGELAVQEALDAYYILRISWVFGKNGHNFVKTMLRLGKENGEVRVVCDQFGAPTYTRDVAEAACAILRSKKYGVYHTPNSGCTTWHGFAREIFDMAGLSVTVRPVTTAEYKTPASRPKNSRLSLLSLTRAGFAPLPHYSDALARYLKEL